MDKIPSESERAAARTRVLSELVEHGVVAEEYGGDVLVVEVAGKTGAGVNELIEALLLNADILDLRAAPTGQAEAIVLDANMEKGRGVVADVLVKWGELSVGDPIVVDTMYGRVKAMFNDKGEQIDKAGPSVPVRLLGMYSNNSLPHA